MEETSFPIPQVSLGYFLFGWGWGEDVVCFFCLLLKLSSIYVVVSFVL